MKLIILDRDGVINHDSDAFIKTPAEWVPIPGSPEAIGRLSQAGWRVVVATNQSGVARGLLTMETLGAIHARMRQVVADAGGRIDAIFTSGGLSVTTIPTSMLSVTKSNFSPHTS